MPLSRRRKKKGFVGRPTQARQRPLQTTLPQLLATSNELDRMEEELLKQELEKIDEKENDNAHE